MAHNFLKVVSFRQKSRNRLSFIGKDVEKALNYHSMPGNLADHGVRKYESFSGRFTSVDPLWEKYYGWSPYVYCRNEPVRKRDGNGRFDVDINNKVLIQKNNNGYYYTMYDGTKFYPGFLGFYTNCAGWAFVLNQTGDLKDIDMYDKTKPSFDPDMVEIILKHDGFGEEFTKKNKVKKGDYVIYRHNKTNKIEHVAIVIKNNNGDITVQYTNNGLASQQETKIEGLNESYQYLNISFVRREKNPRKTNKESVNME